MKKTDFQKYKGRSAAELAKEVAEHKDKLWSMERDLAGDKLKNVRSARMLRKDIARLKTLIGEKEKLEKSEKK